MLFPAPTALLLTPYPPRVPARTPARPRPTRQTGPGPSVLHPLFCLCGISQNTHYWSRCLIPFSSEGGGRVCLVPTKPQHLGRNLEVPEGVRDSTVSHRNEPDHLPHGSGEREGPSSSRHRRVLLLGLPPLLEEAARSLLADSPSARCCRDLCQGPRGLSFPSVSPTPLAAGEAAMICPRTMRRLRLCLLGAP